ncbi:MAG: ABC transporter ATP-binding protein/permease [Bacteroidia bacterium]|nr:ABC transporter ATP-binding protein/permease [Bacteroidia bacterium]
MNSIQGVLNLLSFFWKDLRKLPISILLALLYTGTILVPVFFHEHFQHIQWLTIWAIIVNLFHLIAKRISIRLSNSKINEIRWALLNRINAAGALENEQKSVAERLGNFNLLSDQLFYAGISIYGQLIYGVLFLAGVSAFSVYIYGFQLLLIVPGMAIIWLVNYLLIKKIKALHSRHHQGYVELNKELVGISSHYLPFKSLQLLDLKLKKLYEDLKHFGKSEIAVQDLRDINTFLNQSIIVLAFVLVARNFKSGLMVGDVLIWTVITFEVKKILIALFQANGYIYQGSMAFSKIYPELEFQKIKVEAPIKNEWDSISWQGLEFSYPGKNQLKKYPDFSIKKGDKVWIKGTNGSGKTTLWKLIFGFYPAKKGEIFISPQRTPLNPDTLSIGLVTEPVNLIPGKLWEVIGAYKMTREEVIAQINRFGLDGYLEGIPEGLEHDLGNNAKLLSAGQLKITQFLQAIIKNPDVLVLDEPFTAVDEKWCKVILAIINNQLTDKTVLYISHQDLGINLTREYQLD